MKKILTLLAILMVAVTSWADQIPTEVDEKNNVWYLVSNADEFATAVNTKGGAGLYTANVRLIADIDLSEHTSYANCIFNINFQGRITGEYTDENGKTAYHMLKNSTVDLLFNYLTGAEISNLIISNCSFKAWDTHSGWIGTSATDCTFKNIYLFACSAVGDSNTDDCDNVGGLIGISTNCEFTNIKVINSHIETDGQDAGLIVGKDTGSTFTNCATVGGSGIWADGNSTLGVNGYAYCGGICGEASGSTFTDCVNTAVVASKDDRTGGIIGYGTNTTLLRCINSGIVCHAGKDGYNSLRQSMFGEMTALLGMGSAGTIVGLNLILTIGNGMTSDYLLGFQIWADNVLQLLVEGEADHEIFSVFAGAYTMNFAIIAGTAAAVAYSSYLLYNTFYAADEIGGIAGTLAGGSQANACANYGGVNCQDVECGGIVGYLDGSTVKNSLNRGLVDGMNNVGGIAGYCCNSVSLLGNINLAGVNASSGWTDNSGQIYGAKDDDANVTSANNYYVNGTTTESVNGCKGETPANFATGSVALAINEAMVDTMWHQNLGKSMYPCPEASAGKVTAVTSTPCQKEKVFTAGDFYMNVTNPYAVISLENDIDLKGGRCFNIAFKKTPFRGKIYGNNHVLSNISYEVPCATGRGVANNAAMFSYANGALFENFTIRSFHLTQQDVPTFDLTNTEWPQSVESFLVANSTGCTYTNIKVQNSTIFINDGRDHLKNTAGLVAISSGDTFTGCSLDGDCQLQALTGTSDDAALVGGIAGTATGSTFTRCYSSAIIWADDNRVGGIVGNISGGSIDQCLNTGSIVGQEYVGGIVGYVTNASVTRCVNTGVINDDDNTQEKFRAGVAGALDGSNASIAYCWNFGSVNYAGDNSGQVSGTMLNSAKYDSETTFWYCQYNGTHAEKLPSGITYSDITSGNYAYTTVYSDNKTWLYQNLDSNNGFPSHMPVPVADAGTVYSNILCDGTQSYSNVYQSTASHTGVANAFGLCKTCGNAIGSIGSSISITNASELNYLATYVNKGTDFTNTPITLANDIDMDGYKFTPIGNSTHPFKGTFNGNGHRIKNLALNGTNVQGTGLFGFVGACTIEGVVIDKSCSIEQPFNQLGTAGIVGCVKTGVTTTQNINIYNCGNEANVTSSGKNAGGILGDILDNDNTVVKIFNCYNTGNISGTEDCGSIIAYAKYNTNIDNTWNSGTISGQRTNYPFAGTYSNSGSITNCCDVNTPQQTGITQITSNDIKVGTLWNKLTWNLVDSYLPWTQDIGTDSYPTFGSAGIYYTREMSSNWGTLVLPFDIDYDADNTDYNLYYLSAADDKSLTFTEYADGTTIKAGTPMAVKKLSGDAIEIEPASNSTFSTTITPTTAVGGLSMKGTYETIDSKVSDDVTGVYFISQDKFWKADAAISIAPFRAWFEGTSTSGNAKSFTIIESDEADGIDLTPTLSQGEGVHKYLEGGKVVIFRNGKKFNINGQVLK